MKKMIIGTVVCLTVCVSLIPSYRPKDPDVTEEAQNTRTENEVILTLRHRARTTTVPADADHVEIEWSGGEMQIPLEDLGAIANIVHLAQFAKVYAVCLDKDPKKLKELRKFSPRRFSMWERIVLRTPLSQRSWS